MLARRSCASVLIDNAGHWDSDLGAAADMDEGGALELCTEIRRRAPGACVGDQPWYAIEAHGDIRRTAARLGAGGPFRGFPVDEFAMVTTWDRFRQAYIYRKLGAHYRPTFARMDEEWGNVDDALRAVGLDRPLRVTLQGPGWALHEQVDALINRGVSRGDPVIVWCDTWPDEVSMRAIRAALWLEREGSATPGTTAESAVRLAQVELNRRGARLAVDGRWGPATHAAAGLP